MTGPTLALLLVSLLWGTTFVAVKAGLGDASPLLFLGIRFSVAALAATLLVRGRRPDRAALLRGIPLGVVAAGAYAAQTLGLVHTTPARSAFITGINVALVPLWGIALLRRRPGRTALFGLLLTVPGLWLLTSPGTNSWNVGDSWTVVCAVLFALHVILISRYAPGHDTAWLLFSQLAVTAVLALAGAATLEDAHLRITVRLATAIGITAVLATVGTTWLQLRFQPRVEPTQAALFYATEPVFAAGISYLVVGETLAPLAWLGGAPILAGMILADRGVSPGSRPGTPRSAAPPSRSPRA